VQSSSEEQNGQSVKAHVPLQQYSLRPQWLWMMQGSPMQRYPQDVLLLSQQYWEHTADRARNITQKHEVFFMHAILCGSKLARE
jgi:hypothetical protein